MISITRLGEGLGGGAASAGWQVALAFPWQAGWNLGAWRWGGGRCGQGAGAGPWKGALSWPLTRVNSPGLAWSLSGSRNPLNPTPWNPGSSPPLAPTSVFLSAKCK